MTGPRFLSRQVAPMTDQPLWSLTVAEASRRVASGALSPVDLVEAFLARIAAVDDRMPSYVRVDAAGARAAAKEAAEALKGGRRRGPLHGCPSR